MDPLSAFGLAVNILTVIDFSFKIFSSASEIVKSGATEENRDLKTIISDLQKLSKGLRKPALGTSEHHNELNTLAQGCQTISKELEDKLTMLQVKNETSRIKKLGVAIRSVYEKQSISDRVKTLEQYKSQILLRMVAIVLDRQFTMHLQIDDMQSSLKIGSSQMAKKLNDIKQEIQATQRMISQPLAPDQLEGVVAIQRLEQALDQVLEQSAPPTPEIRVLNQLYRNTMYYREDQIVKSSDNTFTWLLGDSDSEPELDGASDDSDSEPESDQASANSISETEQDLAANIATDPNDFRGEVNQQQRWVRLEAARQKRFDATTALLTWLSSENGLFHISGRAGSGKSTLMKMIYNNPRTRQELDLWSGDKQLVLSHHFFYSAGSLQARSLEGLYRSILFETLLQQPDLISKVFPEAYSAFQKSTTISTIDDLFFRFGKIQDAMNRLIEHSSGLRYRLCLFIDGLDEFGESNVKSEDHQLLAKKLMSWARMPNVKILASSRPYDQFLTVFKDQRQIQLHELNELDILEYGLQRFESFENEESFLPTRDCYESLLEVLAERSNGIFLWASVVVSQLLHKLSAGERIATLRMQLYTTPPDITELYHQILKSIEPSDFEKALRMFWLAICYPAYSPFGGLSLLAISWADDLFHNYQFPSSCAMATYTLEEREDREKRAKKQLNYTKGFLETSSKSERGRSWRTVVFFHRTAYDFIRNSDELRSYTSRYAGVTTNLLKIRLALAEIWFDKIMSNRLWSVIGGFHSMRLWNMLVEKDQDQAHYWLDAFERIIKYRLENGSAQFPTEATNLRGNGLGSLTNGQLSWPHWMLCVLDNDDFVISRLERMPSLSLRHKELSPLLSCALRAGLGPRSRRTRLIRFLLQHGASPNERVIATYQNSLIYASVWQFFCVATADCLIKPQTSARNEQMYILAILEQFLQTKLVDPDVLVLLAVRERSEWTEAGIDVDDATHGIALLDLVRQRVPDEFDRWTTLFRAATQCSKSWLQELWLSLTNRGPKPPNRRFSGKYLPFTLDMELPEPYRTSGGNCIFKLQAIVVGGTMLPADNLHVKLW